MKKFLAILASAPLAVFADGGTTTSTGTAYAGSVAETIANNASATMGNFLTGVAPVIATIVSAGLAVWAGIALVGILKKAFGAGKGR